MWTMCFHVVHMTHIFFLFRLFSFCVVMTARGFVDNVDKWTIDLKSLDPTLPNY